MTHGPTSRLTLLGAFSLVVATTAPSQDPQPAQPAAPIRIASPRGPAKPEKPVYDEQADLPKVVAAAVARAGRDNKRVLIQWGANWCGWCKLLAGTMASDKDLRHEILYEYEVVHADVGKFDKNIDFAKSLGAEFKSIPYLTILDGQGKAVTQQNTEPFETKVDGKGGHDPAKVLEWLKQHEAAPLDANQVLATALATAKEQHKMVFLHFGAPWCPWCHRLEDWMAEPEIAAILGKDFLDVKVDNDRMTGGKEVYAAQLAAAKQKAEGIPWFVFLDGDGAVRAHATAAAGNIGFPAKPEEIDHFLAMLATTKVNLTDADLQKLRASLEPKPTPKKKDGDG